jgi:hypothetical protein
VADLAGHVRRSRRVPAQAQGLFAIQAMLLLGVAAATTLSSLPPDLGQVLGPIAVCSISAGLGLLGWIKRRPAESRSHYLLAAMNMGSLLVVVMVLSTQSGRSATWAGAALWGAFAFLSLWVRGLLTRREATGASARQERT